MRAALLVVALTLLGAVAGFGVAKATVDDDRPCLDTVVGRAAACAMPAPDGRVVAAGAGLGSVAGVGAVAWRRR